ncbi:hypothetical protein [Streptomyces sp. WMMB303]|uniref:hypothetical protein n=1 Tax=Streptomyces sp. WMMB303 TaxID=3034154 RepID=UPI0023EB31E2|nr:hypothetical protein [Streptomyces sp. WMMB303]MDF4254638.1 hypothetical protein [Streptomyces sp. WMMB303]
MTAVRLDLIIGPERARQFIRERVQQLVTGDCIPQARAADMVCTAVLAGDPWVLADPGQTWIPRDDGQDPNDLLAAELYVAQRHGATVLVEDEWAQRAWRPVSVLDGYVLDTWHWARQASPTEG